MRAEGFSFNLDVLKGGLVIAIFDIKKINFFQFLVIKTLDPYLISLEMLDQDPMNLDQQHWF